MLQTLFQYYLSVRTDLYQNLQNSVIEQQAALLVLPEKQREHLVVLGLLGEMLIAVMIPPCYSVADIKASRQPVTARLSLPR